MKKVGLLMTVCLWMLTAAAQDFTFVRKDSVVMRLEELPADRLTLLVFYDPDCGDCRQELFGLRHSTVLRQAVEAGQLQVVCVYADADEALWRETCGELPAEWTVAMARDDVHQQACYDLSALPVLYLLNQEKQVVATLADLYQLTGLLNQ